MRSKEEVFPGYPNYLQVSGGQETQRQSNDETPENPWEGPFLLSNTLYSLCAFYAAIKSCLDDDGKAKAFDLIINRERNNNFGFFTPFQSVGDFAKSLIHPITAHFAFGLLSGVLAGVSLMATLVALSALIVACGAALFGQERFAEDAFDVAAGTALFAVATGVISAASGIIALIVPPLAAASLITRTGTTLVSPIIDCIDPEDSSSFSI